MPLLGLNPLVPDLGGGVAAGWTGPAVWRPPLIAQYDRWSFGAIKGMDSKAPAL